ncbi:MAG: hypothetical protein QGF09_17870, partial [Rhodospirillales bacterium]|nr:hypothetical protein [Rhodospirillales bacterium]
DVFAAGEEPLEGFDRQALVDGLLARGHRRVTPLMKSDELAGMIAELAGPGDMVVCLGAGSITNWANALPAQLAELMGGELDAGQTEARA